MTKRLSSFVRRLAPVLSAGVLLQAGGCPIDTNLLLAGLVEQIATSFITSLVFGAFNLI